MLERLKWFGFVITLPRLRKRLVEAHERGLYALACDDEASLHEGYVTHGIGHAIWRIRCYAKEAVSHSINGLQPKPTKVVEKQSLPIEFKKPLEIRLLELYQVFISILCLGGFCYFALYLALIEPLLRYFQVITQ